MQGKAATSVGQTCPAALHRRNIAFLRQISAAKLNKTSAELYLLYVLGVFRPPLSKFLLLVIVAAANKANANNLRTFLRRGTPSRRRREFKFDLKH